MHRFLTLPILVPMLLGVALLVSQPRSRARNLFVTGSALATSVLSFLCILASYYRGADALACVLVRFSESFSISLRIDGASMVYGAIVSFLWPLVTVYALDYMSHEGHESRFFSFWLMAYGVVLGIANAFFMYYVVFS